MPNGTPDLADKVIINAALRAAEILSGMGYNGRYGSIHLLHLRLQMNTVTAILHNLIAWQISQLDVRWTFFPKGGRTPDLVNATGDGIQIKATSNKHIKGNKVSPNEGYYITVKYEKSEQFQVRVNEILVGELRSDDWDRPPGTQWAILKPMQWISLGEFIHDDN
jgi:hypothetical protein